MSDSKNANMLAALAAAQRKATPVPKRAEMDAGKFGYMYAASGDVVEHAKRILEPEGLFLFVTSTTTEPSAIDGHRGVVTLHGVLWHEPSGESMSTSFSLPYVGSSGRPDDKASQAAITTGEARLYRLLLAMTTEDAEDEVASHVDAPAPSSKKAPPAPKVEAVAPPPPAAAPPPAEPRTGPAAPAGPTTADDAIEFRKVAERLGLSLDTAVGWASREPYRIDGALSRMKDKPSPQVFTFEKAKRDEALGLLAEKLGETVDDLKASNIHPVRSKWNEAVNEWFAAAANF